MSCRLAHNQLSWSVLLLPCNLIGQLCLHGPGYTAFQFILSSKGSCRPSEGSPRPCPNFFVVFNPFAPGDFAEKRVLKLVEWFSGHCRAIKS